MEATKKATEKRAAEKRAAEKRVTEKSRQGGICSRENQRVEIIVPFPLGITVFGVLAILAGLDGGACIAVAISGGVIFFALNIYFQYFRH